MPKNADGLCSRGRQRAVLAVVAPFLVVTLQCFLCIQVCTSSSVGAFAFAFAFSATGKTPAKTSSRSNKNKDYDSVSIQEAREAFESWQKAASDPETNNIREYIVQEEDLQGITTRSSRISHFAIRIFPDSLPTPNAANLACHGGSLTLNATKVSGGRILQGGDVIAYNSSWSGTDRRTTLPSDLRRAERFCVSRMKLLQALSDETLSHTPLRVLYEDDCMAVVCKPAGVHTMSWSGSLGKSLCLDEILPLVLAPPAPGDGKEGNGNDDEGLPAPLPRHRLDHRVAGPVVVAKTRRASVEIGRSFEEKTVTKEYRAIVVGDVDLDAIQDLESVSDMDAPNQSFTICHDVDDKTSETEVQVVGSTPCNINGVLTDLKLFPRTGRKHQLRIHCARVLGTPILGDDLYWDENSSTEVRKRQGLYLYCKQVTINHPLISQKKVCAGIEEPLRFTRTRKKARKGYEWNRNHGGTSGDNSSN